MQRIVIQGASLRQSHLVYLHQLLGSANGQQYTQLAEHAYRLSVSELSPTQLDTARVFCAEQALDFAVVPASLSFDRIRLIVMDMDSTLINIECIDEIADMCGIKPQIAEITERAMRGEIAFRQSLQQRVKLLAGLAETALQKVMDERLQLNPGARALCEFCGRHGIKTMLVSGGFVPFAKHVQQLAGLDYIHANQLGLEDGRLTGEVLGEIVDAEAKAALLTRQRETLGLAVDQVIAVGDGANDLPMMQVAAAGVAYHAKPIVQQQADFSINHNGLDALIAMFQSATLRE